MGLLRTAIRTGLATKAINIARREASKPENQRKARELFDRVSKRGTGAGSSDRGSTTRSRRP